MPSFSDLPFEVRAMIWKATVEPRTVEVRVLIDRPHRRETGTVSHMFSPTPVPAPLQTCREARNLGLYKQAFSEVEILAAYCVPSDLHLSKLAEAAAFIDGAGWRYVWLNLDIDIVSIGPSEFLWFEPVAPSIRRLKFERVGDTPFYEREIDDFWAFVNIEEVYIVCAAGMEMWQGTTVEYWWPCKPENLIFIDPFNGRVMSAVEMERVFREEQERGFSEHQRQMMVEERRLEEN